MAIPLDAIVIERNYNNQFYYDILILPLTYLTGTRIDMRNTKNTPIFVHVTVMFTVNVTDSFSNFLVDPTNSNQHRVVKNEEVGDNIFKYNIEKKKSTGF